MAIFQIGDLIRFTYPSRNDPNPLVLVLHTNWRNLVHGLNFNYLTSQEQNYIKAVLNPVFESEIVKRDQRIATQMNAMQSQMNNLNVTSPHDFYLRFVRGFIKPRGWDPYRLYHERDMGNVRIATRKSIMVGDEKENLLNRFAQKFQHMRGPQGPAVTLPNRTNTLQPEPTTKPNTVSSLGKGGAKKLSDL